MRSLLLVLALVTTGCVGELTVSDPPAGNVDAGTVNMAARQFFDLNVLPLMSAARPKQACAVCHQGVDAANGPDFLGAGVTNNYDMLVGNTRLVGTTAATSVLLTRGDHTGDAWCTGVNVPYAGCAADEIGLITQWINLEAGN